MATSPPDACCYICLSQGQPPPIQYGCACRSDTGLVHTACAIAAAKARYTEDAWSSCATCHQEPTGPMRSALAEACVVWSAPFGRIVLTHARIRLARTYIVNGRYDDAEAMLAVDTLQLRADIQAHGAGEGRDEQLVTLRTVTAECFKYQCRYTEALAIYRQLAASLGPDSYEALCTKSNLAKLLADMGQTVEAEAIQRDVVVAASTRVHPDSTEMLTYESDLLLSTIYNLHDLESAESALRSLVARSTRVLGAAHPLTHTIKANLALALHRQQRDTEAVCVQTELLETAADSPDKMLYTSNLASYLLAAYPKWDDKWALGMELSREVLDASRRLLGDSHPNTLLYGVNLAGAMVNHGMEVEAEPILRTVCSIMGTSDPTSMQGIGASHALSVCLFKQGKRAEALQVMTDLVAVCRKELGQGHATTSAVSRMMQSMTGADVPVCAAAECDEPGTRKCGGCQVTAYCSAPCQKRDWKKHRPECHAHAKINK
jgi:tetratricopeptide (TPR) repeat protein